ncbi:MAG TPA: hypothetical protein ACFYD4_06215 [Candidatus Wunengus sp. YC61]|uniref:hypothetical protein n=1 Tax=Candidatus Wunengus sp. YC61 TaxID=3367698 RepID=UPI0040276233
MDNIDKVVDKILKEKLTPSQIRAFATVISALKGISTPEPNIIPVDPNTDEIMEDRPISLDEITGIQVDNGARKEVKVYGPTQ